MRILRNYILREFLGPLFTSLLVFTFVMLLGNLTRLANLVINKGIDLASVAKLFGFLIPALLTYTLPIAVLSAIFLSLGRLSSDNEIIAIRTSGIHVLRLIIIPLFVIGLILSLLLSICNDRLVPYAHFAMRNTLNSIGLRTPAAALEAGTFIDSFNKYIIFIYNIDGNRLREVRIYEPQGEDRPCRTIVAKRGEFVPLPDKGMVKLKLTDGASDEPDPSDPSKFYKLNFKTLFLNLNLSGTERDELQKKPKDMTFEELKYHIEKYRLSGIEVFPLITEFHKRIALAFSIIVFVLMGSSLAMLTRRREKSINFLMTFTVAGTYYLLLLGASALSLQGCLDPAIAMWLPNILFTVIGTLLLIRVCAY